MAYDKIVDSAALEAGLTLVADAIRTKAGIADKLLFPDGYTAAVEGIQTAAPFCVVTIEVPAMPTVGGDVYITSAVAIAEGAAV